METGSRRDAGGAAMGALGGGAGLAGGHCPAELSPGDVAIWWRIGETAGRERERECIIVPMVDDG